jgi:glycosyltransferase involved in cell wall biosynthesis
VEHQAISSLGIGPVVRILNITNQVPYPLISGAPLRTYNILRRFAKDFEVYLAAFWATEEQREGVSHLLEFCREVTTVKFRSLKETMSCRKFVTSMLQGEPPELRLAFSEELAGEIGKLANRIDFDIVLIEHGSMGLYLEALPAGLRKRTAWVLHDIDFDKFMRIAHIERRKNAKTRAWIHATMMRRWQPHFAGLFGLCVTMSEADRRLLLSANSSLRVEVSPNGVDTNRYRPLPDEADTAEMIFIGNMAYPPNADAAVYFSQEVLPLIRKEVADAKLWIVGINPTASVLRLGGNGVVVTGGVPDVVPYYGRSKVCVVPLRAGSGTRLKILEAMALGRAVVSTSIGCEGLDLVDGEHILIADNAGLFAKQVVNLLTHNELRSRITKKAREFVVASCDWDAIAHKLINNFDGSGKVGPEWQMSRQSTGVHTIEAQP